MTSGGGGMSSMMGGGGSASFTAYLRSDREMTTNEIVEEWRRQTRNLINCEVSVSSSSGMSSMTVSYTHLSAPEESSGEPASSGQPDAQ